jgi:hypothetical protein
MIENYQNYCIENSYNEAGYVCQLNNYSFCAYSLFGVGPVNGNFWNIRAGSFSPSGKLPEIFMDAGGNGSAAPHPFSAVSCEVTKRLMILICSMLLFFFVHGLTPTCSDLGHSLFS